ncbi:MAG: hypothetical protein K2M39_03355 [Muribaculaceae bacterium]|nr:hypothetical protein [Muribaculaceae bacterium]
MIDTIISLIQTFGGLATGIGVGMFTKSGRIKNKSDAYKAMAEAYEYRIDSLHEIINKCNDTEKEHASRIAELNHELNEKTDRIRSLQDELLKSERDLNRINEILLERERLIAELMVGVEYLLEWRCEKSICKDEEGRIPPNGRLQGKKFEMPKIVAYLHEKSLEIVDKINLNK